jgi:hypothetical protein
MNISLVAKEREMPTEDDIELAFDGDKIVFSPIGKGASYVDHKGNPQPARWSFSMRTGPHQIYFIYAKSKDDAHEIKARLLSARLKKRPGLKWHTAGRLQTGQLWRKIWPDTDMRDVGLENIGLPDDMGLINPQTTPEQIRALGSLLPKRNKSR